MSETGKVKYFVFCIMTPPDIHTFVASEGPGQVGRCIHVCVCAMARTQEFPII